VKDAFGPESDHPKIQILGIFRNKDIKNGVEFERPPIASLDIGCHDGVG